MIKQNVYLLPENLNQLSNLIIGFIFVLLVLIDNSSSQWFFENLISML